jgi:4-hydroxybenzoate polyprenyltransferase
MAVFQGIRRILEMIRFSHTLFALPFALMSAVLAWHSKPEGFSWLEMIGIVICMVCARSAAMAFNRLVDRDIDAANPRTARRHLPTGSLSIAAVVMFTWANVIGFVAATLVFLLAEPSNPWPVILSMPVLLFIGAYSYMKRFTFLAHFWLGVSLLLAPLSAWIAIRGLSDLQVPLILGLAVCFWVAGFDIIYACQDAEFDRQARLKSIPVLLGVRRSLWLAFACHMVMMAFLLAFFWVASLGTVYLAGIGLVGVLLICEHLLVHAEDLTRVNQAFFHVNAVISLGLLATVVLQLIVEH